MSVLSQYWMRCFTLSLLIYCFVFISNAPIIGELPVAILFSAMFLTYTTTLTKSNMVVPREISRAFAFTGVLLLIFIAKHFMQVGFSGLLLAIKIISYHIIFTAGLLVARFETTRRKKRNRTYWVYLFLLPILFFIVVARNAPQNEVVSLFNRNSFAAYTIISSALLLGLVTQRPILSFGKYFFLISLVLVINETLGAILAFTIATVIYFIFQKPLSGQALVRVAVLGLIGVLIFAFSFSKLEFLGQFDAFSRLAFVFQNFINLYNGYSGSWLDIDMSSAVNFAPTGETHMSAMFRIVHWINIESVLFEGGWSTLLLGGGTDWIANSRQTFTFSLAAHNEYLRLIVEQGLILGGIYAVALVVISLSLIKHQVFIPLFAFIIFAGTENLLNNFVTTSFFIFLLSYSYARNKITGNPIAQRQ